MVRTAPRARRNVAFTGHFVVGAPLIVTAQLPEDIAAWATGLRATHFPAERNFLNAHVTLFHALPPTALAEVKLRLASIAAESAPPAARLSSVLSLGRGTALRIESPHMEMIRAELAEQLHGLLSAQDIAPIRLHLTIQNKVTVEAARDLQDELRRAFEPRDFAFRGMELHIYRGGPWEFVKDWRFRGRKGG